MSRSMIGPIVNMPLYSASCRGCPGKMRLKDSLKFQLPEGTAVDSHKLGPLRYQLRAAGFSRFGRQHPDSFVSSHPVNQPVFAGITHSLIESISLFFINVYQRHIKPKISQVKN